MFMLKKMTAGVQRSMPCWEKTAYQISRKETYALMCKFQEIDYMLSEIWQILDRDTGYRILTRNFFRELDMKLRSAELLDRDVCVALNELKRSLELLETIRENRDTIEIETEYMADENIGGKNQCVVKIYLAGVADDRQKPDYMIKNGDTFYEFDEKHENYMFVCRFNIKDMAEIYTKAELIQAIRIMACSDYVRLSEYLEGQEKFAKDEKEQHLSRSIELERHRYSSGRILLNWLLFVPRLIGALFLSMGLPEQRGKDIFREVFNSLQFTSVRHGISVFIKNLKKIRNADFQSVNDF